MLSVSTAVSNNQIAFHVIFNETCFRVGISVVETTHLQITGYSYCVSLSGYRISCLGC